MCIHQPYVYCAPCTLLIEVLLAFATDMPCKQLLITPEMLHHRSSVPFSLGIFYVTVE